MTVPTIVIFPSDSNETAEASESGDEIKPANGSSRSRKKVCYDILNMMLPFFLNVMSGIQPKDILSIYCLR